MYPCTFHFRAGVFGRLILLLLMVSVSAAAPGQETQSEPPLTPLTEQESVLLDQLLEKIESDRQVIAVLADRLDNTEGMFKSITYARLDRVTGELFNSVLDLARQTIKLESQGKDSQKYRQLIEKDLKRLPETAFAALDRVTARVNYRTEEMATVDLVEADQRLFSAIRVVDDTYQLLFDYLAIADEMQFDVDGVREKIGGDVAEAAASRSVFLDMAIATAVNLRASAAILPENTDIAGELRAAESRVTQTAAALQNTVGFLRLMDIEDRQYRQQILTATGQITTDVFDVGIVADLVAGWSATLVDLLTDQGPKLLLKIFLMVLIVYLAIRLSRLVEMGINRGLDSSHVQISHLLRRMIVSTVRNLVVILGALIALSQLGISLGPLLAGLGIAGFIIGFAMQDALSNFASGMLILFYRPFDVGDTVEAGGVLGKVRSMSLVNTTIMTFDNQALVVPNNLIWSTVITNVTAQRTRRVDLTFGISYSDDIEKAERIFREIVTQHEKVLDSPEPMIHLHELGDSSVNFIVRPWVKTDDYWDVYWDVTRTVKIRLDEEGISIPFPQRDVHMYEARPT
jgi:small conductance mechanosensitive channel